MIIKNFFHKLNKNPFLIENTEPSLSNPVSQLVTKKQCDSKEYQYWSNVLKLDLDKRYLLRDQKYSRKIWEWVYILQVLKKNNLLQNGKRGLGFGVGREPLVAVLAHHGCEVTATDLPKDEAVHNGWDNLGQYSFDIDDLNEQGICDNKKFAEKVTFKHQNMNNIDSELENYDFIYSSCALEHLGNLEKGITFINKSLQCLKLGGVAIHTTEFNVSSDTDTIQEGPTVFYRKNDIIKLARKINESGHNMIVNFSTGNDKLDKHYDIPPYFKDGIHLKLLMDKYVVTSIGLIIHKHDSTK